MERVTGVEPVSLAWEARVIPIYDTRELGDSILHHGPNASIGYYRSFMV